MDEGNAYTASCNTCGWQGSPRESQEAAHAEGQAHRSHCEARCPCCLGSGTDHATGKCEACDGEGTMVAYERLG